MKEKGLKNPKNSLVYCVVRSRANRTEEGEERTSYVLNLIEIRNQKGILNEIESIYKNLYNKNNETID